MLTTTLNRLKLHSPCSSGALRLLRGLDKTRADDERLPFARILEINGLDEAEWCCRAEPKFDRIWRLYAVRSARRLESLMSDQRSVLAVEVAERFLNKKATLEDLDMAWRRARDAEKTSGTLWHAASFAARTVAPSAAEAAAWTAAMKAGRTSWWVSEREAQREIFLELVS